nr:Chain H, CYS-THR-THR-LYS-ILE-LYS-PRO [Homo sapiens]4X6N_H Chain H, cleaved peptide [Homo sapiens]5Q0F_H Chain H, MET-ASP-ASP-ASP-ASP-LYS-MET-ASP-ASN-GLU-CYS-THR-THR-LYS-ILE-LYS-PRO-ARG [Homo sapiens]5QQO_H Chain H, MET-ASP-ASP-ASP-ASP-LYS-MET-ASP-ASN-GLU-CYS-THR-THR-LYS-ILE-LYS-PRO-ARG [Homo sapiens]5QTU_H Chain H, Coagulation factor XI [Homo sapiens]5QTX_H Chain H, Coagulation factor XI [Homo sapiens]6TWC_H Chain H, Coagulation factor XI [Homo sapiens]
MDDDDKMDNECTTKIKPR